MAKRLVLLLFVVLLLFPLINAVAPFQVGTQQGYLIKVTQQEYIKQNADYEFDFHIFNASDGVPITNASTQCFFDLDNSTGQSIYKQPASYVGTSNFPNEWEVLIKGGNFSYVGVYSYIIQCNSSTLGLGGFESVHLRVTSTGQEPTTSSSITYASFFIIIIAFFLLILFIMSKLPDDERNNEGEIISVNMFKYAKSLLVFIEYILVVVLFYLASNVAFAYLGELLFAKVLFVIYRILFGLAFPIILFWFFWIIAQIIQDRKFRRLIQQGIYPQGNI